MFYLPLSKFPTLPQAVNTSILAASQHRVMEEDPAFQSQFLEHYIPPGPGDLGVKLPSIAALAASSGGFANPGSGSGGSGGAGGRRSDVIGDAKATSPGPSGSPQAPTSSSPQALTPLPRTFDELCDQVQTTTVRSGGGGGGAYGAGTSGGTTAAKGLLSGAVSPAFGVVQYGGQYRPAPGTLPQYGHLAHHGQSPEPGENPSSGLTFPIPLPQSWRIPPAVGVRKGGLGGGSKSANGSQGGGSHALPGMSPASFAGSMSACLGDMMESLVSSGRNTVLSFSPGGAGTISGSASPGGSYSRGSPLPSLSLSGQKSAESSSGGPPGGDWRQVDSASGRMVPHPAAAPVPFGSSSAPTQSLHHHNHRGGGAHGSSPSPLLDSPLLLSKTKFQPIMSPSVGLGALVPEP